MLIVVGGQRDVRASAARAWADVTPAERYVQTAAIKLSTMVTGSPLYPNQKRELLVGFVVVEMIPRVTSP